MRPILLEKKNIPYTESSVTIGVFAPCDPRIDDYSRARAANIVQIIAGKISGKIMLPNCTPVKVVYSNTLIDGEREADSVAKQFKDAGVNVLVCIPDTWSFPQLTVLSFLSHFPPDTPINLTCGNSAPKPGVVYTHAVSGAAAQSGRLLHINVGSWADEGESPEISQKTIDSLIDWLYAAVTYQELKGKRVVVFGHDSMGMETALAHVIPTRNQFGIEITRLDMKLLADMISKKAYDKNELTALRSWIDSFGEGNVQLNNEDDSERFNTCLSMYLIVRDLLKDLNAVGGGFMSQLEWGSDRRGIPLPVPDLMESLFNTTFDHNGAKPVIPFATEADVQGLLTMLFMTYLSAGNPPLFMDFRKVYDADEINGLIKQLDVYSDEDQYIKGFVDGVNSGSASFNWAALPGTEPNEIMKKVKYPLADKNYFPGSGNSVTFVTPGGIKGIAARLAYSTLTNMFSMVWDEAETVTLNAKLATKLCNNSDPNWPHTFVRPKYATMEEYKHYAPANHFHMTWNLKPARLQYWMDLANVLSSDKWRMKPNHTEEDYRLLPLLYVINGGETQAKLLRQKSI